MCIGLSIDKGESVMPQAVPANWILIPAYWGTLLGRLHTSSTRIEKKISLKSILQNSKEGFGCCLYTHEFWEVPLR